MQEEKKEYCEHDHHGHDEAHCHAFGADHVHSHDHTCDHDHKHDHTHEHMHHHTHEHTHDGVTHTHEHDHVHSHTHTHGGGQGTMEEVTALLGYLADHNRHHAEELADMGDKLRSMGHAEAADRIAEGVKEFTKANELFAQALELVKNTEQ